MAMTNDIAYNNSGCFCSVGETYLIDLYIKQWGAELGELEDGMK